MPPTTSADLAVCISALLWPSIVKSTVALVALQQSSRRTEACKRSFFPLFGADLPLPSGGQAVLSTGKRAGVPACREAQCSSKKPGFRVKSTSVLALSTARQVNSSELLQMSETSFDEPLVAARTLLPAKDHLGQVHHQLALIATNLGHSAATWLPPVQVVPCRWCLVLFLPPEQVVPCGTQLHSQLATDLQLVPSQVMPLAHGGPLRCARQLRSRSLAVETRQLRPLGEGLPSFMPSQFGFLVLLKSAGQRCLLLSLKCEAARFPTATTTICREDLLTEELDCPLIGISGLAAAAVDSDAEPGLKLEVVSSRRDLEAVALSHGESASMQASDSDLAQALQIAAPLWAQQIPPVSQFRFAEPKVQKQVQKQAAAAAVGVVCQALPLVAVFGAATSSHDAVRVPPLAARSLMAVHGGSSKKVYSGSPFSRSLVQISRPLVSQTRILLLEPAAPQEVGVLDSGGSIACIVRAVLACMAAQASKASRNHVALSSHTCPGVCVPCPCELQPAKVLLRRNFQLSSHCPLLDAWQGVLEWELSASDFVACSNNNNSNLAADRAVLAVLTSWLARGSFGRAELKKADAQACWFAGAKKLVSAQAGGSKKILSGQLFSVPAGQLRPARQALPACDSLEATTTATASLEPLARPDVYLSTLSIFKMSCNELLMKGALVGTLQKTADCVRCAQKAQGHEWSILQSVHSLVARQPPIQSQVTAFGAVRSNFSLQLANSKPYLLLQPSANWQARPFRLLLQSACQSSQSSRAARNMCTAVASRALRKSRQPRLTELKQPLVHTSEEQVDKSWPAFGGVCRRCNKQKCGTKLFLQCKTDCGVDAALLDGDVAKPPAAASRQYSPKRPCLSSLTPSAADPSSEAGFQVARLCRSATAVVLPHRGCTMLHTLHVPHTSKAKSTRAHTEAFPRSDVCLSTLSALKISCNELLRKSALAGMPRKTTDRVRCAQEAQRHEWCVLQSVRSSVARQPLFQSRINAFGSSNLAKCLADLSFQLASSKPCLLLQLSATGYARPLRLSWPSACQSPLASRAVRNTSTAGATAGALWKSRERCSLGLEQTSVPPPAALGQKLAARAGFRPRRVALLHRDAAKQLAGSLTAGHRRRGVVAALSYARLASVHARYPRQHRQERVLTRQLLKFSRQPEALSTFPGLALRKFMSDTAHAGVERKTTDCVRCAQQAQGHEWCVLQSVHSSVARQPPLQSQVTAFGAAWSNFSLQLACQANWRARPFRLHLQSVCQSSQSSWAVRKMSTAVASRSLWKSRQPRLTELRQPLVHTSEEQVDKSWPAFGGVCRSRNTQKCGTTLFLQCKTDFGVDAALLDGDVAKPPAAASRQYSPKRPCLSSLTPSAADPSSEAGFQVARLCRSATAVVLPHRGCTMLHTLHVPHTSKAKSTRAHAEAFPRSDVCLSTLSALKISCNELLRKSALAGMPRKTTDRVRCAQEAQRHEWCVLQSVRSSVARQPLFQSRINAFGSSNLAKCLADLSFQLASSKPCLLLQLSATGYARPLRLSWPSACQSPLASRAVRNKSTAGATAGALWKSRERCSLGLEQTSVPPPAALGQKLAARAGFRPRRVALLHRDAAKQLARSLTAGHRRRGVVAALSYARLASVHARYPRQHRQERVLTRQLLKFSRQPEALSTFPGLALRKFMSDTAHAGVERKTTDCVRCAQQAQGHEWCVLQSVHSSVARQPPLQSQVTAFGAAWSNFSLQLACQANWRARPFRLHLQSVCQSSQSSWAVRKMSTAVASRSLWKSRQPCLMRLEQTRAHALQQVEENLPVVVGVCRSRNTQKCGTTLFLHCKTDFGVDAALLDGDVAKPPAAASRQYSPKRPRLSSLTPSAADSCSEAGFQVARLCRSATAVVLPHRGCTMLHTLHVPHTSKAAHAVSPCNAVEIPTHLSVRKHTTMAWSASHFLSEVAALLQSSPSMKLAELKVPHSTKCQSLQPSASPLSRVSASRPCLLQGSFVKLKGSRPSGMQVRPA
ncbi:unnamed protein product [Polarella glacialis]|uniref:Uncharacterized protein n=1 Tax=Polarella glacialis TaxID=89957 RepID=A0A813F5Z0_POLGL|nr:unnamed protein product [Polarella glacialis]